MRTLLLQVNLLHPLWHGQGDWPPSPFRLFQAMVAGAFGGRWPAEDIETQAQRLAAFHWLERQEAPFISAPPRSACRAITSYVPNNDLDSVGGDPGRVDEIRAEKVLAACRLEGSQEFLYAWHFEKGEEEAALLCQLAERLHTFGRGLDPAWAKGEVMDSEAAEARLLGHGVIARPTGHSGGNLLPCPMKGSLESLIARHQATSRRLRPDAAGKTTLFRQPSKADYQPISYDRGATRLLFEIRDPENLSSLVPIPQVKASILTEAVREEATRRLGRADEKYRSLAERFIAGRGAGVAVLDRRVRIVPLPTIGHPHASPSIRRIGVEIPPECPIGARDVEWAFLGLQLTNESGFGSVTATPGVLVPAESDELAWYHYGMDRGFRRWRSVTPVALPEAPVRAKTGLERSLSEARCSGAFVNALRHAGIKAAVSSVRIQREPLHGKGAIADAFESTRFGGRLRHVEVVFETPVAGPLILGDGRFVGLGVMRPVDEIPSGLHLFAVGDGVSPPPVSRSVAVARAFRRAVMSRAQALYDRKALPLIFHGHEPDGAPAHGEHHGHLFFAAFSSEGGTHIDRLAVMVPGLCDRTTPNGRHCRDLALAVDGLHRLYCGRDGVLDLTPVAAVNDSVFGSGPVWTVQGYRPTRHPKRDQSIQPFIEADVQSECTRRGLPRPDVVQILSTVEGPRGGLTVELKVTFARPVSGPLLLGRESHFGAGLFRLASH